MPSIRKIRNIQTTTDVGTQVLMLYGDKDLLRSIITSKYIVFVTLLTFNLYIFI